MIVADCTNTADFLAEWARMHDAQQRDEHGFPKDTCTDDNCIGCPLDIGLDCKECWNEPYEGKENNNG